MVTNQSLIYFFSPSQEHVQEVNISLPKCFYCALIVWILLGQTVVSTHNKKVLIPWGQGDFLFEVCMFSPCLRENIGCPDFSLVLAEDSGDFSVTAEMLKFLFCFSLIHDGVQWHRALKTVKSCSSPVYFMLLLQGGGPWIWMYGWLLVPLHKTGSDKRVEMDLDPASLSHCLGDGTIRSVFPWLILLIFRELSPQRILDLALQSGGRQSEAFKWKSSLIWWEIRVVFLWNIDSVRGVIGAIDGICKEGC